MKQMFTLAAAAAAVSLLAGCNGEKPAEQKAAPAAEAAAVIIYSNADEEAQKAMKNALDANGMKGLYKIQGLGTSELGGKLAAEGKNIEADVVTTASYYLDSLQRARNFSRSLRSRRTRSIRHRITMRRSSATAERSSSILRCSLRTSCLVPPALRILLSPSMPVIFPCRTFWVLPHRG